MIETATRNQKTDSSEAHRPPERPRPQRSRPSIDEFRPRLPRPVLGAPSAPPTSPRGFPGKPADAKREPLPKPTLADELVNLARQAEQGDQSSVTRLRQILDKGPEIWRAAGDVGAIAERAWIEQLASGNVLASESISRRLHELKSELTGTSATPLERLLIDTVGVTWLAAKHAELNAASSQGGSLQQAGFRLKRAESAQRRFLGAIKALGKIRALLPRAEL